MGDGESPRLTADAELNYYRLRSGIDRITAQVNYLQEYIRTQCLKGSVFISRACEARLLRT